MKIRFWGVRGSLPAPLTTPEIEQKIIEALLGARHVDLTNRQAVEEYVRSLPLHMRGTYGGNTPCVEVRTDSGDLIILDAGTGIRNLGLQLMETEFGRGEGEAVLLFSHTHWDHIQGLPFFLPLYVAGNRFRLCGRHPHLEERLRYQHQYQFFPVTMDYMAASIEFYQMQEQETFYEGRVGVRSLCQDHPGDSYAYRIEANGKVFVYASDAEYKRLTGDYVQRFIEFFSGAHVLVFDSQYTLRQTLYDKVEWGHSSALIGIDLATEAKVETLILFHHDHLHSDKQINKIFSDVLRYRRLQPQESRVRVIVGHEGLELQL
jgi:phosphoribosyl 1,2-cyclic phosphodiesterase